MLRPGFISLKLISALGCGLVATFILGDSATKKGAESNGAGSRPIQAREKKGTRVSFIRSKIGWKNRGRPAVKEYAQ